MLWYRSILSIILSTQWILKILKTPVFLEKNLNLLDDFFNFAFFVLFSELLLFGCQTNNRCFNLISFFLPHFYSWSFYFTFSASFLTLCSNPLLNFSYHILKFPIVISPECSFLQINFYFCYMDEMLFSYLSQTIDCSFFFLVISPCIVCFLIKMLISVYFGLCLLFLNDFLK